MTKTKLITLVIAILGTVGTAAGAITGALDPKWAVVIGTMGAGSYALARTLQKVLAGETWKSLLACTESWAVALPIVAAIIGALAGVVPVAWATGFAVGAGALLKLARVVQALKLEVPVAAAQPRLAVVSPADEVTKPEHGA